MTEQNSKWNIYSMFLAYPSEQTDEEYAKLVKRLLDWLYENNITLFFHGCYKMDATAEDIRNLSEKIQAGIELKSKC